MRLLLRMWLFTAFSRRSTAFQCLPRHFDRSLVLRGSPQNTLHHPLQEMHSIFSVDLGNLEAHTEATVRLSYLRQLDRVAGALEYCHTATWVPPYAGSAGDRADGPDKVSVGLRALWRHQDAIFDLLEPLVVHKISAVHLPSCARPCSLLVMCCASQVHTQTQRVPTNPVCSAVIVSTDEARTRAHTGPGEQPQVRR